MNKPRLEDKDKVATVYNSKGEVCETFAFRDHGNSYLSAAQNYLMQNYDKLMAEEVEQMDEVSGSRLGKYIVAAREKEKEEKEKGQKFVQQLRDAGMKGFGAPLYHKGAHFGKASRENMIKLAVNKLTNPDLYHPVSKRVKVPATESVEQMDEAKGEYGPDSSLHGHPLRDIDAHLKDNGYIHSKKSDTTHHYTRKDGRMVVHVDSKTKKVVKAFLEPIKKLKEEAEQMDEGNKENKKKKNEYVSNIIKKKLSPEVLPSLKYGRRELKKEEVEQMDEISQDLALRAHAKANDVTSRRWNDKFAGADLADKGSQGMFHHSSSGEEAADRTAKRLRKHIKRKFGPEAAARAKRSEFGVVAPADTTPKKKSFLNRLGLTKEEFEHTDNLQELSKKTLGSYIEKASDDYAKSEGEWADNHRSEFSSERKSAYKAAVRGEKRAKGIRKAVARLTKEETMEEVEQMDEVAPPGREKQVKALKGKVDNPYAVAWASYNKSKAETKSENTMYNNMLTKLEEGRGRPPKPGSEAWKRRQSAAAAGGAHVETPHIATQLMKHADYGFKNHTYKFSDGSTHEITPTQRDTVLRKLRSMTGPGKKPEDREKMYDEINTPTGFFHHTGDKPIASKKLHPMSAQKE